MVAVGVGRKAKRLLLKLRHWLIKKLGGYTEQTVLPPARYPPSVMLHPERVVAQARVNMEMVWGDRGRWRFISDRMKEKLIGTVIEEIIKEDYAVLTCDRDISAQGDEAVYTLGVCIMRPNEWMKTSLGDFMRKGQQR